MSVSACFCLALCLDGPCWSLALFSVSLSVSCHLQSLSLYVSPVSLRLCTSLYLLPLSFCCRLTPAALRLTEKYLETGFPVELYVQFPSLGVPSAPLCYSWELDLLVTRVFTSSTPSPNLGGRVWLERLGVSAHGAGDKPSLLVALCVCVRERERERERPRTLARKDQLVSHLNKPTHWLFSGPQGLPVHVCSLTPKMRERKLR